MRCQNFWIDHDEHTLGHCENEDARYLTCTIIDAIVCKECSCRCYKNKPPLTDEEIQEILDRK